MAAVATRPRTNNNMAMKLRTVKTNDHAAEDDDADDGYVIETDVTDEEIAYMKMCLEEYRSGRVKYIDFEDIDWGL